MPVIRARKKPVEIEAMLNTPEATDDVLAWIKANGIDCWRYDEDDGYPDGSFHIHTLEGGHRASPGDWIIRGVKGEMYPCKPDIFDATYEVLQ